MTYRQSYIHIGAGKGLLEKRLAKEVPYLCYNKELFHTRETT
jgi:hypothetical protein